MNNKNNDTSSPRAARWWFGPLISLLTLLIMLLAAEAALRLWLGEEKRSQLPRAGLSEDEQMRLAWIDWQSRRSEYGTTSYPSSFDTLDPQLGWRVKANASARHVKPGAYEVQVTTNRFGLRGADPAGVEKPDGVVRVGLFGDSQTFGETVNDEETYVAVLKQRYPQNEFLNFGVRGYGTDQMLLNYRQQAAQFDLDVVVLGFAFFHMERNARGFLFYAKPFFTLDDGRLKLGGVPVPDRDALLAAADEEKFGWLNHSVLARWVWQRLRNLNARGLYSADGEVWRLTEALIEEFVNAARADGSRVVILSIDDGKPQLEDELRRLAERLDAGLVNLGPPLRAAAAAGESLTLPNDNHWNAAGNARVAAELGEYLCAERLIDCAAGGRRDVAVD